MSWIESEREVDIQVGASDARCIFIIIHLPSTNQLKDLVFTCLPTNPLPADYPEERPVIELEGVFGEFKEGLVEVIRGLKSGAHKRFHFSGQMCLLQAFVDFGNEYAANRHKGLVDIVHFFAISTPFPCYAPW